jgi:hypothetical protein
MPHRLLWLFSGYSPLCENVNRPILDAAKSFACDVTPDITTQEWTVDNTPYVEEVLVGRARDGVRPGRGFTILFLLGITFRVRVGVRVRFG